MALIITGCSTQRRFSPERQIVNFNHVDKVLYRGAQPTQNGLKFLKATGVKSVVSLRMENEGPSNEKTAVEQLGMTFTSLPMNGVTPPTTKEMRRMLNVIESLPSPVFVHCQYGCDRTGTVVACWRILHGWTNEAALQDAKSYGISPLLRGMREFIRSFKF